MQAKYRVRISRFHNLEGIPVVLRKRFAVELVHHLDDADHHLLSVEYRNAQQTLHDEPVLLRVLRASNNAVDIITPGHCPTLKPFSSEIFQSHVEFGPKMAVFAERGYVF